MKICQAVPYQSDAATHDYAPSIIVTRYRMSCGEDVEDYMLGKYCSECGGRVKKTKPGKENGDGE